MQTDPAIIEIQARLAKVEEDQRYIHDTITSVKAELAKTHGDFKTEVAVMQRDISYIKEGQDKVVAGINKLLWAIILSVVAAFMAFALKGGLNIAT